jgi:hypothetical protein
LNFPRTKRCTYNAICEYEGKHYCGIHDPIRKKRKSEENEKKKEQTREKKMKLHFAYLKAKQRSNDAHS